MPVQQIILYYYFEEYQIILRRISFYHSLTCFCRQNKPEKHTAFTKSLPYAEWTLRNTNDFPLYVKYQFSLTWSFSLQIPHWPTMLDRGRRLDSEDILWHQRDSTRETTERDSTRDNSSQKRHQPEREIPTEKQASRDQIQNRIQRDQIENKERPELWRHITVTPVGRARPQPVASRST